MRRCCLIHLKNSSTCRRAEGARGATALVEGADGGRRQRALVGQEHQRLARLWVLEAYAPHMFGVVLAGLTAGECDGLVADDAICAVASCRVDPTCIHVRLGARDKKGAGLMQSKEPRKIDPGLRRGRLRRDP